MNVIIFPFPQLKTILDNAFATAVKQYNTTDSQHNALDTIQSTVSSQHQCCPQLVLKSGKTRNSGLLLWDGR